MNWKLIEKLPIELEGEIFLVDIFGGFHLAYKSVTGWRFRDECCSNHNLCGEPMNHGGLDITHYWPNLQEYP